MKEFDFPKAKRHFLERVGYIESGVSDEDVNKAYMAYQKEHPPPLTPSREDSSREAECLICLDVGWVYPLRDDGTVDASRIKPCVCYETRHHDEMEEYKLGQTGIPEARRMYCFESFVPVEGADEAFNAAVLLGQGRASFKLLLIYGFPGNGKTHLAYSAALLRHRTGEKVRFITFAELMSRLRRAMEGLGESTSDVLDEMKQCDFLVLDDLGASKESEWTEGVFEEIVNYRYANELDTFVTTNKDIKSLSEPIISRFRDGTMSKLVRNTAPDYRPKLKRGKV